MVASVVEVDLPFRLGFFLRDEPQRFRLWHDLEYRGVDRGYIARSFAELEQLRTSGRGHLAGLYERWWEAADTLSLHADPLLARALVAGFRREGLPFEVIYVEVAALLPSYGEFVQGAAWSVDLRQQFGYLAGVHHRVGSRPPYVERLGLDLSRPRESFHSAIFEPGLDERYPDIRATLNEAGLVGDLETARSLLTLVHREFPAHAPYCVLEVFATGF